MRKLLLLTTGLAWLVLGGAANAALVTLGPEGPADPLYFAPEAAGQNNFTLGGISWAPGPLANPALESTEKGSVTGQFAAPLGMGSSTTTGTTYMSVKNGGDERATFATPQTSLRIYWGSIDDMTVDGISNEIAITVDGFTLTGAQLVAMGALGQGSQTNPKDNQFVTITGLEPFTTVDFTDHGKNAFEFSLASVPEPSTWAMMAIGFVGLGYAAFRRNSKGRALAI